MTKSEIYKELTKPSQRKKYKTIELYMGHRAYELLKELSEQENKTRSQIVRELIFLASDKDTIEMINNITEQEKIYKEKEKAQRKERNKEKNQDIQEIVYHLNKIGGNLNQVAYHLNIGVLDNKEAQKDIEKAIKTLQIGIDDIKKQIEILKVKGF